MRRSFTKRILIIAIVLLAALFVLIYFEGRPRLAPGQQPLVDIKNIDTLGSQFNLDAGKTRLIILVSPTWVEYLQGTSWVQNQLHQYPSARLRVYAVWIPMLGGDAREDWDGRTMPDSRVIHFWDGEKIIGQWFAREVDGYQGIAWDVYYLYGPGAVWETVPSRLVSSGGTIYHERETLKTQLLTSLEE